MKCFFVLALMISFSFSSSAQSREKLRNNFAKLKYGMFLHFNMGTFVDKEWATGYEDPLLFNPTKLDCEQWATVAKSAGMNYAFLTVKHTGGWCLWDSKFTTHVITAFKDFKNTDIIGYEYPWLMKVSPEKAVPPAGNKNLLLDVPPDRDGVIEDLYIKCLMEIKKIASESGNLKTIQKHNK